MRRLLLGLTLFVTSADRTSDRDELLNADRALARAIAATGMAAAFVPALTDDAAYLHPGAPLLRGRPVIRAFFANVAPLGGLTWEPAYADVSADGTLGYTYGWTRFGWGRYDGRKQQGKYLACWRKQTDGTWRVSAFARSVPVPDSAPPPPPRSGDPAAPVGGPADPVELLRADSAFAGHRSRTAPRPRFSPSPPMQCSSGTRSPPTSRHPATSAAPWGKPPSRRATTTAST